MRRRIKGKYNRKTHVLQAQRARNTLAERKKAMKEDSQTEEYRGRDLSGHGKKASLGGALTLCGAQREGLIRAQKQSELMRGTHILERTEGGSFQDTERK